MRPVRCSSTRPCPGSGSVTSTTGWGVRLSGTATAPGALAGAAAPLCRCRRHDARLLRLRRAGAPTDLRLGHVRADNVRAGLEGSGITCPPADRALVFRYLDHCVAAGVLPAPATPAEVDRTCRELAITSPRLLQPEPFSPCLIP
ncbi:hypothetical protein ACRAWF_29930 [Streptomyces sp. L7]